MSELPTLPILVTHEDLCRMYTSAYRRGHHSTVEGGYTDVLHVDAGTYWAESVDEFLAERDEPTRAPTLPGAGGGDALGIAVSELRNIATVSTRAWDDPVDFEGWARSRARHALSKIETKDAALPPQQGG